DGLAATGTVSSEACFSPAFRGLLVSSRLSERLSLSGALTATSPTVIPSGSSLIVGEDPFGSMYTAAASIACLSSGRDLTGGAGSCARAKGVLERDDRLLTIPALTSSSEGRKPSSSKIVRNCGRISSLIAR